MCMFSNTKKAVYTIVNVRTSTVYICQPELRETQQRCLSTLHNQLQPQYSVHQVPEAPYLLRVNIANDYLLSFLAQFKCLETGQLFLHGVGTLSRCAQILEKA